MKRGREDCGPDPNEPPLKRQARSGPRPSIPMWMRHTVLARQGYRCANRPDQTPIMMLFATYKCPMWRCNEGHFDAAGYVLDHKVPYHIRGSHEVDNLQALCPHCHAWKTTRERAPLEEEHSPSASS